GLRLRGGVVAFGDFAAPFGGAVRDGHMGHQRVTAGAVPVLLPRLGPDDVAAGHDLCVGYVGYVGCVGYGGGPGGHDAAARGDDAVADHVAVAERVGHLEGGQRARADQRDHAEALGQVEVEPHVLGHQPPGQPALEVVAPDDVREPVEGGEADTGGGVDDVQQ